MALNSHFFREVFLLFGRRLGLGPAAGLVLSILLLWGTPPALGVLLINRRAPLYRRRFREAVSD